MVAPLLIDSSSGWACTSIRRRSGRSAAGRWDSAEVTAITLRPYADSATRSDRLLLDENLAARRSGRPSRARPVRPIGGSAAGPRRCRCPGPSSSGCGTGSRWAGWPGSARRRSARSVRGRCAASDREPGRPTAAPACTGGSAGSRSGPRRPSSTILPRYITPTRSEMCRTTDRSWAMKTYARPSSSCRSSSRLTTWACTETSSAETGSSQTITFGLSATPRAIPIRCR